MVILIGNGVLSWILKNTILWIFSESPPNLGHFPSEFTLTPAGGVGFAVGHGYRATQATALLPKKQRLEKHVVVPAIRSKDHTLKSMVLGRRALSGFDDKRWICEDGTSTRALGHFALGLEQ